MKFAYWFLLVVLTGVAANSQTKSVKIDQLKADAMETLRARLEEEPVSFNLTQQLANMPFDAHEYRGEFSYTKSLPTTKIGGAQIQVHQIYYDAKLARGGLTRARFSKTSVGPDARILINYDTDPLYIYTICPQVWDTKNVCKNPENGNLCKEVSSPSNCFLAVKKRTKIVDGKRSHQIDVFKNADRSVGHERIDTRNYEYALVPFVNTPYRFETLEEKFPVTEQAYEYPMLVSEFLLVAEAFLDEARLQKKGIFTVLNHRALRSLLFSERGLSNNPVSALTVDEWDALHILMTVQEDSDLQRVWASVRTLQQDGETPERKPSQVKMTHILDAVYYLIGKSQIPDPTPN